MKKYLITTTICILSLFLVYSFKPNPLDPSATELKYISTAIKKDSLYDWNKEYKSPKYDYTIKVPEPFTKTQGNRPHIDLKFVDAFGSSILVNISP